MAERGRGSVFGHPKGLAVLSLSEFWERFSYAGMQALLVLYATHWLFQPGKIETIWGFAPLRRGIEAAYGPLGPAALASAVFGLYAGFIYLTPLLGGLLADRMLGKTRTVILGALLLTAGHWLMGSEQGFLIALVLLVLGVGCFKTNVTAQVGDLYEPGDARRASGYQIFVLFICFAAFVAPLVCGTLGERYGWPLGFGAAGIGMVVGLATYLLGRRWRPAEAPTARREKRKLGPGEARTMLVLVLLLPVLALASVGNEQMFNAYLLWAEGSYRLTAFGQAVPVTWLLSLDAIVAMAAMVAVLGFWRWWGQRHAEPDEVTKLTIGAGICVLAPLLLAGLSLWGGKLNLGWAVLFHTVNEIGYSNVYPVGLALYSRRAPRALGGTTTAIFYLHMFVANMAVGWLGGLLQKMPAADFWLLHAALIGGATLVLLVVRRLAGRLLAPV